MNTVLRVSPTELLENAEQILKASPRSVAHRRAASLVARQAIEAAVRAALGDIEQPGMRWRSRFLVLETERRRTDARRGYLLWRSWSDHAHYRAYDLVPDAPTLHDQLTATRSWIEGVAGKPSRKVLND